MKHNDNRSTQLGRSFVKACALSCQRMLAKLQNVKESLTQEFRSRLGNRNRMLDLALHEAESLAYETGYPQLVFPSLAREKAEAVVRWNRRQKEVRQNWFELVAA